MSERLNLGKRNTLSCACEKPGILGFLHRTIIHPLTHWHQRRRSIAILEGFSNHMLADIGITRGEILHAVDGLHPHSARRAYVKPPKGGCEFACERQRRAA